MFEDFTMEKKPSNRSTQVPGKLNGTEVKKSQDVSSKPSLRSSRRREPNGSSGTKVEPNRKPVPQKNKTFDKRPRPRGQFYGSGSKNTKVAEDVAEYGSVLMQGSKKQNLNHLLNFHYAPRERVARSGPSGWGRSGSAHWLTSYKHKYNKEQFIQANCQFVVKADGNYSAYTSNPDTLVNWDLIEQIRVQSSEMLSCPICLYPPVAAKMTRCGHVYCWPCMLHYLALSDKSWRKCPICYEAVHKQDLKSVMALPHTQLSVGKEITMRLMRREKGSLVALPVEQCGIRPAEQLLSVSENLVDTVYSKLLVATPDEVKFIVDKERKELQKQLSEDEDCPETCFIEQAIGLLDERCEFLLKNVKSVLPNTNECETDLAFKTSLHGHMPVSEEKVSNIKDNELCYTAIGNESVPLTFGNFPTATNIEPEELHNEYDICDIPSTESKEKHLYTNVRKKDLEIDDDNTLSLEDLEMSLRHDVNHLETSPVKQFYFYQAEDGQHIYLHALNTRMLIHNYGTFEQCPAILKGEIVEKESGSMTDELRQRLRHLQHLPVTCQFEVAEIQLKPPVVSHETVDHFKDQLENRRRRRQRRARDEKRREKKINDEENRRLGLHPSPQIQIKSHRDFPQFRIESDAPHAAESFESIETNYTCLSQENDFPTIEENENSSNIQVHPVGSPQLSFHPVGSPQSSFHPVGSPQSSFHPVGSPQSSVHPVGSPESSGLSFAQMLREGKSKNFGNQLNMAKYNHPTPKPNEGRRHSDSDPEPEGYVPAPAYRQSFSDAISLAIEKACQENTQDGNGSVSGKKKKKHKQKILFATGMAYSGK